MRVLLLSFYYPPDIGPAPLRAESIVDALLKEGAGELKIDVITTMPNRYRSYRTEASVTEVRECLTIQRVVLPGHASGMFDQAKAFAVFAWGVLRLCRRRQWDVVAVTSSRLMTAALAAFVAKRTKSKLYVDIRDLFADTMCDILDRSALKFLLPVFRKLERWTFNAADRLNVVSGGFVSYIKMIAPEARLTEYTNGTDVDFVKVDFASVEPDFSNNLIVYAGNIGDGQGLQHILPAASKSLGEKFDFRIIGDGGRRNELKIALQAEGVTNVKIIDPVPRDQVMMHYGEADVLFLHLNDFEAFRKVLPSKIFEYAATNKPILAGVSGYAANFLRENVTGVEIFEPCNAPEMHKALARLLAGPRIFDRSDFCAAYSRKKIMQRLAKDIIAIA